jgi:hypothetical protein
MGRRGGRSIYLLYWCKSANADAVNGTKVQMLTQKALLQGGPTKKIVFERANVGGISAVKFLSPDRCALYHFTTSFTASGFASYLSEPA